MIIMGNLVPCYYYHYSLNFLFFFLFINTTSLLLLVSSSPSSSCHSEESSALLQFKQLFSINCKPISSPRSWYNCDPGTSFYEPATNYWIEGTDCCEWDGVQCDYVTGHVVELYLYESCLYGTIPPNSTLFDLLHLHILDLSCNNFYSSQISPSFGRLRNLTTLSLAYSNLSGQIPSDFHLPNLVHLDLAGNRISGKIPSLLMSFSPDLEYLDLSCNKFSGTIEPSMFGKKLRRLFLSSNKLSGTIEPSMFGKNLTSLALSSNKLSGTIELDTFAKLKDLTSLDLSHSGLSLTTARSSVIFQRIRYLVLSSCNISYFPFALLKNSNSNFEFLSKLDLKNNSINEQLHPLICNLHSLNYLDLSNNHFYGLLPDCLGNFSANLAVLNLQGNNFHGTIPQTFGHGSSLLEALDFSHNGFQGGVPRSLANCSELVVLNLGHNSIVDVFPSWLEGLVHLKVLVLRDNWFYGPIEPPPRKKSFFNSLHIIDVSHNDFIGTLPEKYFDSWDTMMVGVENASQYMEVRSYFYPIYEFYSLSIMNKGREMDLEKILSALFVVDFSYNNFHGKIPISLGRLKGLRVLNFSGNAFTGLIPLSLMNLTYLESLDLSRNKLFGEIPQQFTSLTFLEVFDVSQNNLTGLIPRGRQFETFSNTSYEGNPGLCGFPLSKNCGNTPVPTSPSEFSHESKFEVDGFCWEIVVIGYGCGLVIGLVIGSWIIQKREEWLERIFHVKIHSRGKRSKKIK